ncbi:hypothetical protein P775_23920 [Puniceibacterium antarcticum]|uniref:Uncharacterized protein n=1 Tax=Puniceibacterium antarcticum TaxID=1206336 RepID=A0A2G8R905_9RHOB|nr:hypothetical protein [Puniceibacterium antarcticum]PIL17628.1 hypothetical protein P775_23920 [Puniceibacterium antarcticum]
MMCRTLSQLIAFSLLLFAATTVLAVPLAAAENWMNTGSVIVVATDHGGPLRERAELVEKLRREGRRVEIRGRKCLSSCTMFLGAGDVCVSPRTIFGFHGPSNYGRALPAKQFEYWSRRMAGFYPPELRVIYMKKWRYLGTDYKRVTGLELIAIGYPPC